MTKSQMLVTSCPNENEQHLIYLLNSINDGDNKLTADILTFKNSLLLRKTNLNNDELNVCLLKNYIFHLFSNGKKENDGINNLVLNREFKKVIDLLNSNISVRYYLSYLYVKMSKENLISSSKRTFKIAGEDYETINSMLNEIDSLDLSTPVKTNYTKHYQKVSAR